MDLGLRDKVACITGGSAGIGLATAEALAAEGAHVILAGRDGDRASAEAERIAGAHGVRAIGVACDLATAAGAQALVDASLAAFGGVDILVNNAGTGTNETIMDADDEKWMHFWNLHVMAAVRLARGFVPTMRERGGGAIIHNASICAVQPLWYEPIYNVTKAALMMVSKTLANEVIGDNIRVNTVNPGLVRTGDWIKTAKQLTEDSGGDWEGYLDGIAKENAPIGRFADPAEVASVITFLCSDKASYVVGSTTWVDGGWLKTV